MGKVLILIGVMAVVSVIAGACLFGLLKLLAYWEKKREDPNESVYSNRHISEK